MKVSRAEGADGRPKALKAIISSRPSSWVPYVQIPAKESSLSAIQEWHICKWLEAVTDDLVNIALVSLQASHRIVNRFDSLQTQLLCGIFSCRHMGLIIFSRCTYEVR